MDEKLFTSVQIYTDGGCLGNPGPGAWAYLIIFPREKPPLSASGGEEATTNNRMELTAVIRALTAVSRGTFSGVELFTDSQYVKNGIGSWIDRWLKNGWKTKEGKPVKNRDLWEELWGLQNQVRPRWHWVKGHGGNPHNEACDALVQQEYAKYRK
ncbi:MAG: ribonuclease HI [Spirochaetales bacterium]|jgi:ribonuclease HI|nr:ribonuclease HI [Spirochaetales bacterium]